MRVYLVLMYRNLIGILALPGTRYRYRRDELAPSSLCALHSYACPAIAHSALLARPTKPAAKTGGGSAAAGANKPTSKKWVFWGGFCGGWIGSTRRRGAKTGAPGALALSQRAEREKLPWAHGLNC